MDDYDQELILTIEDSDRVYKTKNSISIGRQEKSDVVIDSNFISRNHCLITRIGDSFYLEDTNSKNGTLRNGKRIHSKVKLHTNDVINPGSIDTRLHIQIKKKETSPKFKLVFDKKFKFLVVFYIIIFCSILIGIIINRNAIKNKTVIPALAQQESLSIDQSVNNELHMLIKRTLIELGENEDFIDEKNIYEIEKQINRYEKSNTYNLGMRELDRYKPMIYDILIAHHLQFEYIYLAFVESGFNPLAYNKRSGAKGMWQFMPETARAYGLTVNKKTDMRLDVEQSTNAAAKYITDMAGIFGYESFLLIAASYNCGDATLRYALKQIYNVRDNRSFFYLSNKNLLPRETREYVLKIIAAIVLTRFNESKSFI